VRILHLSHGYPPALGGSELVMAELSRRLVARHGHAVCVVTTTAYNTEAFHDPRERTMAPGEELLDGVRVRRHRAFGGLARPLRRAQERAFRLELPGNGALRTLYDGPLAPGMLADALREPAELIGATAFPLLHMQLAVAAGRLRRLPTVLIGAIHPEDRWGYDRGSIYAAIRRARAYVAYTAYEAEHVLRRGADPSRVHVIAPGVDADALAGGDGGAVRRQLGVPAGAPLIGFVGQVAAHKGVDDLVRALPAVLAAAPEAWLVVAGGSTGHLPALRAAVAALDDAARGRVRFLLDFAPERKRDVLAAFDVFASPSGYESFGLTFVEAWAAGLPVIGCRAGAVPSVVEDGVDGLLVPYHAVPELASALLALLGDEALRARLAAAGRARALERYSWDGAAAALDALYRSV
jgi:glycosyltransferase involved in cell wall biosynthesis